MLSRRLLLRLVAGLFVLLCFGFGAWSRAGSGATTPPLEVSRAASPLSAAPPPRPEVLRDNQGDYFSIQLSPGLPDSGNYRLSLASGVAYAGTATLTQPTPGAASIGLSAQGSGTEFPSGDGPGVAVHLTLAGSVVPEGNGLPASGTITLSASDDPSHPHILAAGPSASNDPHVLAVQALNAMQSHDWASLYGYLEPSLQDGLSQAAFTSRLNGQPSYTISSFSLDVANEKRGTSNGYEYLRIPVSVVATAPGASSTTTYASAVVFVLENGTWYLVSSDVPSAS